MGREEIADSRAVELVVQVNQGVMEEFTDPSMEQCLVVVLVLGGGVMELLVLASLCCCFSCHCCTLP